MNSTANLHGNSGQHPRKIHLKIDDDFGEHKLKSLGESLLAKTPYAQSNTSAASKKTMI